MKRIHIFLGGFLVGGILLGCIGVFSGYVLAKSEEPDIRIYNLTKESIPRVIVNTDVGESYSFDNLAADESRRIKISGKDKSLRITATNSSGRTLSSKQVYVTSQGTIFGIISENSIAIDYEL